MSEGDRLQVVLDRGLRGAEDTTMTDTPADRPMITARDYLEEALTYFAPVIRESEQGLDVSLPRWLKGGWFGPQEPEGLPMTACSMGAMLIASMTLTNVNAGTKVTNESLFAGTKVTNEALLDLMDNRLSLLLQDDEFAKAIHALASAMVKVVILPELESVNRFRTINRIIGYFGPWGLGQDGLPSCRDAVGNPRYKGFRLAAENNVPPVDLADRHSLVQFIIAFNDKSRVTETTLWTVFTTAIKSVTG